MSRFSQQVWRATTGLRAAILRCRSTPSLPPAAWSATAFAITSPRTRSISASFRAALANAAAKAAAPPFCNPLLSRHFA